MSDIKNECYKELENAIKSNDSDKFIQICNSDKYKDCIKDVINERRGDRGDTIFHTIVDSFDLDADVYETLIKVGADITITNNKEQTVVDMLRTKQNDISKRKNGEELSFNSENDKKKYNNIEEKINIIEGRSLSVGSETREDVMEKVNDTIEQQMINEEKNNVIEKEEINITPMQDNENNEEEKKNAEMLEKINNTLSEIEEKNSSARSAIFSELEGIDDEKLKKDFITGVLTKKDDNGLTLIERVSASRSDDFDTFIELVEFIPDYVPNMITTEKYFDDNTVLHLLCGFDNNNGYRELTGQSRVFEKILDKNRESIELLDDNNETPLFAACKAGNYKMVKLLVEKGANVSAVNKNNETPLFAACRKGDLEIVEFLVEKGANVFAVNKEGKNVIECMGYMYGNGVNVERFLNETIEQKKRDIYEQIKQIINSGDGYNTIKQIISDIKDNKHIQDIMEFVDANNETLLFAACRKGDLEIVKFLVENGANVFAKNRENKNVFNVADNDDVKKYIVHYMIHKCIHSNNVTNMKTILDNNRIKEYIPSVFQMQNKDSETLLFEACRQGNIEIVKLLVENGADVFARNGDNKSPLEYIKDEGIKKYVEQEQKKQYVNRFKDAIEQKNYTDLSNLVNEYSSEKYKEEFKESGIDIASIDNYTDDTIQQILTHNNNLVNDTKEIREAKKMTMELLNEYIQKRNIDEIYKILINESEKKYIDFNDTDVLKKLVEVRDSKNDRKTLLFKACEQSNVELVKFLMENGADGKIESVIDILEKDKDNMNKKIIKGMIQGYIKKNEHNSKRDIITGDLQDIGQTKEKIEKLYNEISGFIRLKDNTGLIQVLNESKNKPYIKQALNTKNTNGDSIFQLACQYGFDNDTLYLLAQNGADIFTRNNLNKDALDNVNNPTTKQYLNELRIQKIKSQAEEYIANKNYYSLSLLVKYHGKILWKQIKKEDFLNNVNENEKDIIDNIFKAESIIESINNVSIKQQNNIDIGLSNSDAYNKALECILNQDYYNLSLILNEYRRDIIEATHNGDESVVLADIPSDVVYRKRKKNSGYNLVDVAYLCNDNIVKQILEEAKIYENIINFEELDINFEELDRTTRVGNYRNIIKFYIENNKKEELKKIFENENRREFLIDALNTVYNGDTLLFEACRQGNIEIVELLVENGADISVINKKNNETPLFEACKQGNIEVIDFLIKNGADIYLQDLDGKNIFDHIDSGEIDLKEEVKEYLIGYKNKDQEQLKENEQELKQDDILENNAESNFSQYVEENLKQEEVKQSEESVQMLQNEDRKEAQEQVEQQMEQSTQDEEQLQNINTQENVQPQQQPQQELKNNTEINNNQEKVIELYNNIDKLIKENKYGEINNIINDEKNKEYIKDVLNFKPDETAETFLNYKDSITGENLLFKILVHGNVDTFKILVDNGVDAFAKNKSGNTIFNVLKYEDILNNDSIRVKKTKENQNTKNIQIGNYLVRKCIEGDKLYEFQNAFDKQNNKQDERIINEILNLQDGKGETLLFEACRNGNIEVVKLLVEKGANVNIKNNEGKSVLDYTDENQEIRDYLEEQIQKDKEQKQGGIITKNITQQNQEKEEEVVINNNTKSKHNAQELVEERINNNQERVIEDQNINIINNDEHLKQNEDIVINTNQNNKSELDNGIYKNKVNNTTDNINSEERQLERGQVNNSLEQEKVIELYNNINESIKEKKYDKINNIINDEKNREFIRDVLKLQDENGETLLFQACRSGNIQVVELLLNKEEEFGVESIGILNKDGKSILNVLDEEIKRLGEENSSDIKVVRGYIHGYVDKYVKENMPLKWSEINKNMRYDGGGRDNLKRNVTHEDAQQQVYQIAYHYANNPIKDIDQNKTYAISDTHGDMGALLESLLRSGTVEFVDSKEPCIVVVNDYNPDHKILIPNLKLKGGCTNKLMICGDIIDRGQHTYSCMMLMKHLMNQQTQQKSNNIIFTVGNHEDMTADGVNRNAYLPLIDTSDIYRGTNKDYNMAKAVILDMVEQDQMVFCYYDENTNTIYSHVPFDMENTQKALKFIQNNKSEFSEQTQQNIDEILNGLNENPEFFKDNKEGVKQLVDVFNELYKYECEYGNEKLHEDVYEQIGGGLLWNRDYTEDKFKAIPGINCVCGHDPKKSQDVKVNKDGNIINIDTIRSCGYTTDKNQVGLVEISQGENGKLSHKVLEDIGHIKYSEDLKTIETINETKPVILQDNTAFIKKNINSLVNRDISKQEKQTDNVKQQQENNIKTQLTKKEEKELKKQQKKEEKERKKRENEEKKKQKQKGKTQGVSSAGGNNSIPTTKKRRHRFWGFVKRVVKRIIDPLHFFFKDEDKNKEQHRANTQYHGSNVSGSMSHSYPEANKTVTKKKGIKHFKESVQNMWKKHKENKAIKQEIKELYKDLIKEFVSEDNNIEDEDLRKKINKTYFKSISKYVDEQYGSSGVPKEETIDVSNKLQKKINEITKRIDNYYKTYKVIGEPDLSDRTTKGIYGGDVDMYAKSKFSKYLNGIETYDSEKNNKNFIKEYKGTIKKAKKEYSNTMSM